MIQRKKEWEERLLWQVLNLVREEAQEQTKEAGPDSYLTQADFERLKGVLDDAKATVEEEFGNKVRKSKQGIALFNDTSIKFPKKLKPVFMEIYDSHRLYPYSDDQTKAKVEAAGGRPYNHRGYGKDDYGDLVVEPDKKLIAAKLKCTVRTIERQIGIMVDAGILRELKTAPNKPGMYAIGTLGKGLGNTHKRKPFIQRGDLKDQIKAALQSL